MARGMNWRKAAHRDRRFTVERARKEDQLDDRRSRRSRLEPTNYQVRRLEQELAALGIEGYTMPKTRDAASAEIKRLGQMRKVLGR